MLNKFNTIGALTKMNSTWKGDDKEELPTEGQQHYDYFTMNIPLKIFLELQ